MKSLLVIAGIGLTIFGAIEVLQPLAMGNIGSAKRSVGILIIGIALLIVWFFIKNNTVCLLF